MNKELPILTNSILEHLDVEVQNDSIYFYCSVNNKTILNLHLKIKKIHDELLVKERTNGLKENSSPIHLYINSNGGWVHCGLLAYDIIKNFVRPIHTHINGVAASAATLISIAGKERTITKNSFYLIHQVSSGVWGTHQNIIDEKINLDKIMDNIIQIYQRNSKIKRESLNRLLKHDLYLTSQETFSFKLVDKIV